MHSRTFRQLGDLLWRLLISSGQVHTRNSQRRIYRAHTPLKSGYFLQILFRIMRIRHITHVHVLVDDLRWVMEDYCCGQECIFAALALVRWAPYLWHVENLPEEVNWQSCKRNRFNASVLQHVITSNFSPTKRVSRGGQVVLCARCTII